MRRSSLLSFSLLLGAGGCAHAPLPGPDPIATDGDKYRVLLENAQVRVLAYHDEPGSRTHLHHHPNAVIYALGAFERRLTLAGGTQRDVRFSPGTVRWVPAQSHIGENVGTTPTDVVLVELKR